MNPATLRFPDPCRLFATRAARFRQKAQDTPALAGYLALLAEVADLQQNIADRWPAGALPVDRAGMPPLDIWRPALLNLLAGLGPRPEPLAGILDRLATAPEADLAAAASAFFAGADAALDPGAAPFLAAALQIPWTIQAAAVLTAAVAEPDPPWTCPVCGGLPVAAALRTGSGVTGLRFLCCGLCGSQWHRVRSQCVLCGSAEHLAYFALEGAGGAVRAEACGDCRSYLKLLDLEKDPRLDPAADDIASLALDVKMAEEGYGRLGFNPFLVPGNEG
jgi:FdhE protein